MGPQANRSYVSGYLTNDVIVPLTTSRRLVGLLKGTPLAFGGYTRMFETGHSVDFGIGFARHVKSDRSLQFELRDYMTFANPTQHNVMLRVGWVVSVPD